MMKNIIIALILCGIFGCFKETKIMGTYLALGDSYTIGESVAESERYPVQLSKLISEEGIPFGPPKIIAKTGWTTDELIKGIDTSELNAPYDLVTLLIGVNNQYRGRDLVNYRMEFTRLLKMAISFAGGDPDNVIVISIPDWGVTPFAANRDREKISAEIDAFNEANEIISNEYKTNYVSITDISRKALEDPELIATDGLHPSGKMYTAWQDRLLPLALTILKMK